MMKTNDAPVAERQTRAVQTRVPQGVEVQILSGAPFAKRVLTSCRSSRIVRVNHGTEICNE